MKGGSLGTGDRNVVGLAGEMALQFGENRYHGDPPPPPGGLEGRFPKLTGKAILPAGPHRNEIDAKRPAEAS